MKQTASILSATIIASSLLFARVAAAATPGNFSWLTYDTTKADKIVKMKVRSEIPPTATPANYPNLIEMHWKYTPDAKGLPAQEVMTEFARLEAATDPIQGDRVAYLMIVATGNGDRTWLWYAADPKTFTAALNNLLPGHPFPITLHLGANEPDWKTYLGLRGRSR
ncbi:MAG: hypothetical protein QOC81_1895 [Thermoanaerobaculia bacterium]|jgi:hypothetical protein|nr:hypothetical protein [Thermoanaerobaculia bacterium]